MKCLECGGDEVGIHGWNDHYYRCRSCGWWSHKKDYDKIMRNVSQKALEEALEEP